MYLTPYVIEDTGRGERSMDIYSRLLKDRIVMIGSEINDQVANSIVAQLIFLKAEDPKKDVSIYINSPGGVVSAGLAIYDTMNYLGVDINTYCIGQASSMAALLLAAGTKGKRYALPNARVMIHQPMGGVGGTSADIDIQAKEIIKLKKTLSQILADITGKPIEQVIEDSDRDYFMNPEEAVAYGLIDTIVTPKQKST
jgi:ATP-dependent Clp protease protease subunit